MSVLFKALEKAARQNAGAQEAAAPAGGAGHAGAPGAASLPEGSRRSGRGIVRILGLVFVAATAVVLGALVLYAEDVERLLAGALAPQPVFAPPPVATPVPEVEPPPPVAEIAQAPAPEPLPVAPAEPVEQAALPAEPVPEPEPEPESETEAAPAAAPIAGAPAAEPVAAVPAAEPVAAVRPAADLPVDPADDIALLMREGAVRRAAAEGRALPEQPAEPAVPAVAPPTVAAAPERPERLTVEDALAARQGSADALSLTAPITAGRGAAPDTGAVSVSTMAMDTQATLAEAYTDLVRGNYGGALERYSAVAEREPVNVAAHSGRAAALHKLRRLPEAQAAYEKVLALQPDNREALANMIALIGDSAPRDAIRRLEILQAQAPDFSPVPAQLGMLHARLGDVDRAAAALRRAIALSPENPLYHYNLAVVTDRAGRRADAARAYEQVLRLIESGAAAGIAAQPIRERVAFLRARP